MPAEVPSAFEPPWWRPSRGPARARVPLSRDAIVDAALAILDADGVDALTIRRLGQELGTGAASLYWHIAGKDELGELVYDRIMGEITLPDPDPSRWEEQLKHLARQAYRVMLSHNDAVRLSIGRPPAGPNTVRIVEWMLAVMRGAGIPGQPAAYFGNVLGRFLDASVLEASTSGAAARALRKRTSPSPYASTGRVSRLTGSPTSPRSRRRPSPATTTHSSSSDSTCSCAVSPRTANHDPRPLICSSSPSRPQLAFM